ncbi:hypothetical protein BpHYR1_048154 [Brachionus plicatilis]|uniref:Uncharacterized protein n=1 Tax=Brachionus plicatilis TaxID=10195 RepID=A0A3M7Q7V9_BRAPC|nr:hypothetical protein BpHYR1_048154 [Brachionus plicatilis]
MRGFGLDSFKIILANLTGKFQNINTLFKGFVFIDCENCLYKKGIVSGFIFYSLNRFGLHPTLFREL